MTSALGGGGYPKVDKRSDKLCECNSDKGEEEGVCVKQFGIFCGHLLSMALRVIYAISEFALALSLSVMPLIPARRILQFCVRRNNSCSKLRDIDYKCVMTHGDI